MPKTLEGAIGDGNLYKIIVENSPDLVYIVDLAGNILFVSPNVTDLFGYTKEEVLGKKLPSFLMPQSFELQSIELQKVLAAKRYSETGRLKLQVFRKDKQKIWLDARTKLLLNKNGEPVAIVGIARQV